MTKDQSLPHELNQTSDDSGASNMPNHQQVADFLAQNPDFLINHPALLLEQVISRRDFGDDKILDLQYGLVQLLRKALRQSEGALSSYVQLSRENNFHLKRFEIALCMLSQCNDVQNFKQLLDFDLLQPLGLEAIYLLADPRDLPAPFHAAAQNAGFKLINRQSLLNPADKMKAARFNDPKLDVDKVFEAHAPSVHSHALITLKRKIDQPIHRLKFACSVAFGASDKDLFQTGQAHDLLDMLARAMVMTGQRFIDLPESTPPIS
ncbi:MAG: DUF484 family protein [Alphaproteobacteria bacterium]